MKLKTIVTLFLLIVFIFIIIEYDVINAENKFDKHVIRGKTYPVSIKNYDSSLNECDLIIKQEPKRIIAYHQNNIEILKKLNKESNLVGAVGRFVTTSNDTIDYKKNFLLSIPYYGLHGINQEKAVYLRPDFILGWQSSFAGKGIWSLGTTDFWDKRHVNCYISMQRKNKLLKETLDGEFKYILDMGEIFNSQEESYLIVKTIQDRVNIIKSYEKNSKHLKILVLDFFGSVISSYDENRLPADIIKSLGEESVKISRRPSREDVLMADPDIIFLIYKSYEEVNIKEKLLNERIFLSLKAVKNKRVYTLPLTCIYNPGLRIADGIEIIADGINDSYDK